MRVLFAGGGTGGHLYPAIALAEVLESRGDIPIFVTGDRSVEDRAFRASSWLRFAIHAAGLTTGSVWRRLRGLLSQPFALWRAWRIVRRVRPDHIVATGGYVAFPVGLVAALTRRQLVLVEPNAIPGRVGRILARWAKGVIALDPDRLHTPRARAVRAGIPVRRAFLHIERRQPDDQPVLLVVGGSQGARRLNETLPGLPSVVKCSTVIHVTGPGNLEAARDAWSTHPDVNVELIEYADDMPALYARADLAIARAGAATIAELGAARLPAILVPYPFAADRHQDANAAKFVEWGGGCVVSESDQFADELDQALKLWIGPDTRRAAIERLEGEKERFDPEALLDVLEDVR
ncbi:MAG: UDP-N-acetylglucosamine--N-acetylmuramyl-(pentapeptide) pyrophosphoryl-undecaprenol N-acetylglucosamine transferase [Candidatus Dadabacteria bacterium]|nr:MAG: UDP-N-acetylglucosamine--N-acetylmuramyl-(pentapeptide) pyrophosphoryl-undecaprenol N-acetylglucosamine transferase [Candidatus Dadabacteria bacterium]